MKLVSLSLSAFLAVTTSMLVGCSGESPAAGDSEVEASELSSKGAALVGSYEWHADRSGEFVDFESLTLNADGTYSAKVDAALVNPGVRCVTFPCTLPETGKWSAYDRAGKTTIQVRPSAGAARISTVALSIQTLALTRLGKTTNLFKSTPTSACAAVFCDPSTTCVEVSGEAQCVAKEPAPASCAAVLCAAPSTCAVVDGEAKCISLEANP